MTKRADASTKLSTGGSTGTPATVALADAGVPFRVHRYEHDPRAGAYGLEAADRLQLDSARVFKTLVASVDGALAVAVVPVAGQLDLKALAAARRGRRAEMADPALAERRTGYVLGGISPIGQRTLLPTVIDETAILCETVFVSAGRRGVEVELAPDDLLAVTGASYAAIARSR